MNTGSTFFNIFAIGTAGFFGALSRYYLSGWVYTQLGARFPYGTLAVNVTGSLILGFIYTLSMDRAIFSPEIKMAITIGFLGSLTTFSTFSLETVNLISEGSFLLSFINIATNVIFSLIAVMAGITLAKLI